MPRLSLSVLGPFAAYLDERPLTQFRTKSVQALLVYLTCQPEAHQRERLMTLLWPGLPQKSAQASLRQTLYLLRKAIPELASKDGGSAVPFLLADRQTVQINPDGRYVLDLHAFSQLLNGDESNWAEAVNLYRGDFLADFYLPDSAPFEEWAAARRGDLRRQLLAALNTLTTNNIQAGKLDAGESFARRQLEIDNLRESAHRQLMAVLAKNGRRRAALSHYETCRQLLQQELEIEPSSETEALFEAIRSGEFNRSQPRPVNQTIIQPISSASLPPFLAQDIPDKETAVFVAREKPLQWLDKQLQMALEGQSRVVFIAGEAGSGKTALLTAFARRAHAAVPELLVAQGHGSAFGGVGDPFLPFRDLLTMLTGDATSQWQSGAITGDQARNLWGFLPQAVPILLQHGVGLIDLLIPGSSLLNRAQTAVPNAAWLEELQRIIGVGKNGPDDQQQSRLFAMVANVLQAMAEERPLLLLLDDLQWADAASLNLLFHLGRRLGNGRLLILCAYRSDEIALGRAGERHPLEPLRNEFRRIFGENELNLDETASVEGHAFVDAYLDTQPNNFDENFRQALARHTGGQTLFVVELLRDLQARGDLVRDDQGHWKTAATFSWDALPARIEGIIAERLSRLEPETQQILTAASVEGQEFTLQVVAHVQQMGERPLLRILSQELEKRHSLIQSIGEERVGKGFITRYRFNHALFQQYLISQLSQTERRLLHGEIGECLERLYQNQTTTILPQLAYHFSKANSAEKAANYLLLAGDRARSLYIHEEAAPLYERAFSFLEELEDHERAARTQMKLGLTQHLAFNYRQARRAYEKGFRIWQKAKRKQTPTALAPAPHPLRMPWREPASLDPMFLSFSADLEICRNLFQGLVELGSKMDILPGVAQSWEVSEGGRTYTFHLRNDARWSDGVPVTARDFVYAWIRQLQPNSDLANVVTNFDIRGTQAFHEGNLTSKDQVGIHAADDTTLIIELERPTSDFLYKIALLLPIPQHVVEAWGPAWTEFDHFVSNGPFLLTSWQPGKTMTFARNPAYPGQFSGNLDSVKLLLQSDISTKHAKFEAETLDIVHLDASQQTMNLVQQRFANEYVSLPSPWTIYLKFDDERAPFDDPRVRMAFALALDKQKLADVDSDGFRFPATGGFVPYGVPGHSLEIGLPHDREQARSLLAAAGFPDGRGFPEVQALAPGFTRTYKSMSQQWQKTLGISVNWHPIEWHMINKALAPIQLNGWISDYADPANFLESAVRANQWPNKAYEAMLATVAQAKSHTDRLKLYQAADRFLVNQAVFVPILYGRSHYLVKPWIKNFVAGGDDRWQDIIIDPH